MAKDFTGIICVITGKVLDNTNDPFCVNHWQDLITFGKSAQAPSRDECLKLNCCHSIEQLRDWQSKASVVVKVDSTPYTASDAETSVDEIIKVAEAGVSDVQTASDLAKVLRDYEREKLSGEPGDLREPDLIPPVSPKKRKPPASAKRTRRPKSQLPPLER